MREYITVWEGHEPLMTGERIVRCRNCVHFSPCLNYAGTCRRLLKKPFLVNVGPDGFCSFGELKEGVDE